jgi:hypothetical protein
MASLVLLLISSTFMIFPFAPFTACFLLHLSGSGRNSRNGAKGTNAAAGGWQGAEGGAMSAKRGQVLVWREIGA